MKAQLAVVELLETESAYVGFLDKVCVPPLSLSLSLSLFFRFKLLLFFFKPKFNHSSSNTTPMHRFLPQ